MTDAEFKRWQQRRVARGLDPDVDATGLMGEWAVGADLDDLDGAALEYLHDKEFHEYVSANPLRRMI